MTLRAAGFSPAGDRGPGAGHTAASPPKGPGSCSIDPPPPVSHLRAAPWMPVAERPQEALGRWQWEAGAGAQKWQRPPGREQGPRAMASLVSDQPGAERESQEARRKVSGCAGSDTRRLSPLGTREAVTVAVEWEELVGWEKRWEGDFSRSTRLCFVNFGPWDYITSSGEMFKM